ncbi:MAG: Gfo/Idh/MocA family oxidoreductase [Bacteroidetes bacterium]|nr:Gfo/Idh/MocA family oxidoreductase [Bacteroidota bacterium]
MIKIGVLGAGHLGKIHIKLIREIPEYDLIGFYDPDPDKAFEVSGESGIRAFSSPEILICEADAVVIVTPTVSHFDCATAALKDSKHIFIEKPLANTVDEAAGLIKLAAEANVVVQVGHVERFNPAFAAASPHISNPMFIESHRLAQFNRRGTDVPVILDLMIHDIDIVLSTVRSNIRKISASGVAIVSDSPDIANARLEFDNGCVANLTASRISMKSMRKSRFFQRDAYISVDFLNKKAEIVRMKQIEGEPDPLSLTIDVGNGIKEIYFDNPEVRSVNAIKEELISFHDSIVNGIPPAVSIEDGYAALDVAHRILEKMRITTNDIL